MKGWVANTHLDWFNFLAQKRRWEEVNFWNPSDYYTFRGEPGSPFFFRLKSPVNAIGGFGLVSRFAKLPEWLAWDCFTEGNGAATFAEMQARLDTIRLQTKIQGGGELKQIGCIILADAVFFPRDMWIHQPADWGRQNLRYKGYDLAGGEGRRVWRECLERRAMLAPKVPLESVLDQPPQRYGTPTLVAPRLGQGTFRVAVTEAYDRACAVTQEHSLPVLEAAHIKPFALEGPHSVPNGLLLRSDLHRLFDHGYITVTPDYKLEVSKQLKEHFHNGKSYYPLQGREIVVPKAIGQRPDPELLRWHNERFLG
ncbi:MAG: HNH endonuclease [Terriglobia bacterium]